MEQKVIKEVMEDLTNAIHKYDNTHSLCVARQIVSKELYMECVRKGDHWHCPVCGEIVRDGDGYCWNCGQALVFNKPEEEH